MNAVDRAFDHAAAGDRSVAAQQALDEAVANLQEAHERFSGVAARWEALPRGRAQTQIAWSQSR